MATALEVRKISKNLEQLVISPRQVAAEKPREKRRGKD